jgi:NAD(P)H-flavin reductase
MPTASSRPMDDPMIPRRFRVSARRREIDQVFTLELTPVDEQADFVFQPGQFNMLYQFGIGEVPISISGDPERPETLVHTIRAVGQVTRAMQQLAPEAMLGVRGPFGRPWPVEAAEGADLVILAGGLGLAPLRPLIHRILSRRKRYGAICILYGARNPAEILFLDQLQAWRGRFDLCVDVTVDSAGQDWLGKVGVVTKLLGNGGFSPPDTLAFVCGPEIMMRFAVMALNDRGVSNDRIHVSMERNMQCALGFCGHCQFGGDFVCKDGPVFRFDRIAERFAVREL